MRKYTVIAAAAFVFAILPLGAVAAPGDKAPAKPHSHWFAGSVSAVGGSSLSLDVLWTGPKDGQLNGTTVTVSVGTGTEIVSGKDKTAVPLSSIQPGDLVGLRATSADATLASLNATHIRTGPYDTVLKDTNVTIQVNGSTSYLKGKDKTAISLSDLKVGAGVGVVFGANGFFKAPGFDPEKATFTASKVHAWQNKQVPPASTDTGAAGTTP